jgi:hypothetical protein
MFPDPFGDERRCTLKKEHVEGRPSARASDARRTVHLFVLN